MSLSIEFQPLSGSALVRDYIAGTLAVSGVLPDTPFDLNHFRRKWGSIAERFARAERERAAAALRPSSPAAAERLSRFVAEGGAVITTGQQAGLFTGPLYTLYKIVSAIRLAGALERELGILVLPVFWSASEDHDWDEINHTFVTSPAGELRRIAVTSAEPLPVPIAERWLQADIETVLAELAEVVGSQTDRCAILEQIREAYRPGSSMGAAFLDVVQALFAPFDLLVADAADPALKRASVPALIREVQQVDAHAEAVREQTERLLAAGYHAQVAVLPEASNLFFHGPTGRERLYQRGERWYARAARQVFSAAELASQIEASPGAFSPNVFLRPVVESMIFPTLAYVAGPGEIAYFAQIGGLFRSYGVLPPLVYPRLSALLIEPSVADSLGRLGLDRAELARPRHELVRELAGQRVPAGVATALDALRRQIVDGYSELMGAAAAIDPTLSGPLGASRNAALRELSRNERKVLQHVARRNQPLIERLDRVRSSIRPGGEPQERVLNGIPFLCRHPELLQRLADGMQIRWSAPIHATTGAPEGYHES